MPKLTLMVERTALKVYNIDQIEHPIIRVGRETGLEVVIDNVAVSRHQAELRLQDALWFVRDLDSGNGTFLNGRKLAGSAPLKRGDEISFGKFSLFFDHVPTEPAPQQFLPRTGYPEPGRTLVMRPEELAKIRASVVEKRRAHLRWQAGGEEGTFTLADGPVVIGRGDDCDLRVDCRGPKRHVFIERNGAQYEVRNTSWRHRMRVNDKATSQAVLRDGDEVVIGGLRFTFKDELR